MIGDGGQSGFDVADPKFRFHTFYDASPDVNFSGGDYGRLELDRRSYFRGRQIRSSTSRSSVTQKVSKTLFVGTGRPRCTARRRGAWAA